MPAEKTGESFFHPFTKAGPARFLDWFELWYFHLPYRLQIVKPRKETAAGARSAVTVFYRVNHPAKPRLPFLEIGTFIMSAKTQSRKTRAL
jgi:hypothetical protein